MGRSQIDMVRVKLFPGIIRYTIPIILTGLLQLTFNAADMIVVGRFCGSISVAAVSCTGSISFLIINLFIGLSIGSGVTVAHAIGGGQKENLSRLIHTAILTAMIGGVITGALGILLSDPLLKWMDTPQDVMPLALVYMRLYFLGTPLNLIYNFSASILRAAGDTGTPLRALTLAGALNVILNVIFVAVLGMNVAGVALATVLTHGVSVAVAIRALTHRQDACVLRLADLRIHRQQLGQILRIGIPAGIQSALHTISNVVIQSTVNGFGSVFMSGNAAASSIENFEYNMMNAFQQTSMNFVGQNLGARQYDRVKKTVWICLGCVLAVAWTASPLIWFFGEELLSLYITDTQEAIAYGMMRLTYSCLPYFLCGMMDVSTGALRGLGKSRATMILSVLGICGFRILWIYTVFAQPAFHTPAGLYIAYPISWLLTFVGQMLAFRRSFVKIKGGAQMECV